MKSLAQRSILWTRPTRNGRCCRGFRRGSLRPARSGDSRPCRRVPRARLRPSAIWCLKKRKPTSRSSTPISLSVTPGEVTADFLTGSNFVCPGMRSLGCRSSTVCIPVSFVECFPRSLTKERRPGWSFRARRASWSSRAAAISRGPIMHRGIRERSIVMSTPHPHRSSKSPVRQRKKTTLSGTRSISSSPLVATFTTPVSSSANRARYSRCSGPVRRAGHTVAGTGPSWPQSRTPSASARAASAGTLPMNTSTTWTLVPRNGRRARFLSEVCSTWGPRLKTSHGFPAGSGLTEIRR